MSPCPNSINKLFLRKTRYPNDSFDSYFITAEEVRAVLKAGKIPEIRLREDLPGATVAVLMAVERHPDRAEPDYYVPEYYVEALTRNGLNPAFVGFDQTARQLENLRPDAVLLPGGDFMLPPEWLKTAQPEHGSLRREQAYESCIGYAQKHKLPLLGICAGAQVLAGMCGGRLAEVSGHRLAPDKLSHGINIVSGTLLAKVCGFRKAEVNSNHHLAVCTAAKGDFVVSATADDGTIEAVEPANPWHYFVLGVQWHPERFAAKGDALTERLFSGFAKAARGGIVVTHEAVPFAEAPMTEINDPHFIVDLMYARADNLAGQPIYRQCGIGNRAFVRRELWERLQKVVPWLEEHQLKMKICDAFRPLPAHTGLKAALNEQGPGLFASRGETSKHCHGTAVDVLLTDLNGNELPYPTKVDCYTPEYAAQIRAGNTAKFYAYAQQGRHDYQNPARQNEIANREQLRRLMENIGLQPYDGEWWHYEMPDEYILTFPVLIW